MKREALIAAACFLAMIVLLAVACVAQSVSAR